jgi:hypothetical protein
MIIFNPPLSVVVPNKILTVNELPLVIVDVQKNKTIKVQSAPFYKTVTLWEGEEYDAAGDYTQIQVESRFLEILGTNPAVELAKLYVEPPTQNKE